MTVRVPVAGSVRVHETLSSQTIDDYVQRQGLADAIEQAETGAVRGLKRCMGILAWGTLCLLAATDLWADAEQAFKKGLEASDQQDWSEAVGYFRQAAEADGQESSRRVFISGVFSSPYLPHFYLGWSLYRQGPEHCSEALKSWQTSQRQGVVQTFRRQLQDLENGQEACLERLLPPAVSGAEAVIRENRSRLQELLDGDVVDVAHREDLQASLKTLEGRLGAARTARDLDAVQQVTRQGAELAQRLEGLEAQQAAAASRSETRLQDAAVAARRALEDAERAERQVLALLADPTYAEVRRNLPGEGMLRQLETRLEDVRQAAFRAGDLAEYQAVEKEAAAVAEALRESRQRLRDLFDGELRRRAAAPPQQPPTSLPPPSVPSTPVDEPTSESTSEDAATTLLNTRIGDLLDWVQASSPTPLMTRQAQRLETLMGELVDGTAVEGIQDRFDASLEALQLLAAGHAFMVGEPRETLRWIDLRPMADPVLAAHGQLFAAAARFDLFREGGERDVGLLDAARLDVEQSRRVVPDLEPDEQMFSPAFRSFYRDTLEAQAP